jgi:DNA topoisomerase-2
MATKAGTAAAYKKLSHREHILELPDTYIGSIDIVKEYRWIYNSEKEDMEWKEVSLSPGFLKTFDEILVNATDHRVRQQGLLTSVPDALPVKHIDVTLTPERITIKNDGDGIPVAKHESGVWVVELLAGHLLTSSNYDKSEEKIVGGKNGYGSKLTNVFSKEFTITTIDHRAKKKYTQTWRENMSVCDTPKITASTAKSFTEVSYVPDLARFGMTGTNISADVLQVLATRVVDAAMSAGKDCKVSLNGVVLAANNLPKYMKLYLKETDGASSGGDGKRTVYEQAGERWEVGAILTRDLHGEAPPDQRHISFVNGIYTRKGGKHVEYVLQKVLTAFCDYAKKKAKLDITPGLLKESIVLFLNATIVNPSFDTQTKETLTTPSTKFGSLPTISDKFIDSLGKIGLLEEARILLEAKTKKDAKRTDGKKRSTVRGIPKLEDAIWAGGARSADCTLILTEGDSAATTAISGLKVIGREQFGVFPLKGKILNVKDISAAKRIANEELTNINKILGLETGKIYKNLSELRYGKIMIMTDQDVDGSHIKGLLMNLFHTDWPSLLKLGFLCCMMTPLLKTSKGTTTHSFYSEREYEAWKHTNDSRGWKTKYYKGLGTSTAEEAREYFRTMHTVKYAWEEKETDESIDLAFNKKRADDRKAWLATFSRDRFLDVPLDGSVGYSKFVNDELIHFSVADNVRSLPHVMDGLKPSQRKILWSAFKRNLVSEIRVAQLAGYVSETAAYHHGEVSLHGAIIGMAQTFVGSNNINLLVPNGQFGSRLMGGSDAASPRYIHTMLEPILKAIIKKEDDPILKRMDDDGTLVEPETYLPTVPLLLINGALGIGTGYSTTVPSFHPMELVTALRGKIAKSSTEAVLTPWWFGFRGPVTKTADHTYITKGLYEFTDEETHTIRIRELPVGCWTKDYKEFLEEMLVKQEEDRAAAKKAGTLYLAHIKSFEEMYNDIDVDFILHMEPDGYHEAKRYPAEFEKRFKMTTTIKTSNMVAFNVDGKIKKFASVNEILDKFYHTRLDGYARRKAYQLEEMARQLIELNAKYVFVLAIVEKRLTVTNVSDEDLFAGLVGLKLPPLSDGDGLKGYEYLLRMRIDRLKASSVAELAKEVADTTAERDRLAATAPETIWLGELDAFATAWETYAKERTATYTVAPSVPVKKKRTVKPKAVSTTLSIE